MEKLEHCGKLTREISKKLSNLEPLESYCLTVTSFTYYARLPWQGL